MGAVEHKVISLLATRLLIRLPQLSSVGDSMRAILAEAIHEFDNPNFDPNMVTLFFRSEGVFKRTDQMLIRLLNAKYKPIFSDPFDAYRAAVVLISLFGIEDTAKTKEVNALLWREILGFPEDSNLGEFEGVINSL